VDTVDNLFSWTDDVLFWASIAIQVWALVDCLSRKSAAFPAVDKLTKLAWVAIILVSGLFAYLIHFPTGIISLIAAVAAAVYLADVRPAVREVSGGR
jgi:hypothetical protein